MTSTARQVIDEEVIKWLETADISRFCDVQRLEYLTNIWEYGKWCAKGAKHRLGYQPQIKYRGRPDQDVAVADWDAIPDISDDEGMRIHAATVGLDAVQLEILDRVYESWQPPHVAIEQMRVSESTFYRARREALEGIKNILCRSVDSVTEIANTVPERGVLPP